MRGLRPEVVIALSFFSLDCSEWGIKNTDENTLAWLKVHCPRLDCAMTYTVSNEDLVACFGYNEQAVPPNPQWGNNAPTWISDNCFPNQDVDCEIPGTGQTPEAESPNCPCEEGYEGEEVPDPEGDTDTDTDIQQCCHDAYNSPGEDVPVLFDPNVVAELAQTCGLTLDEPVYVCDDPAPNSGYLQGSPTQQECPEGFLGARFAIPPTTDFLMTIDPVNSYLLVTTATESLDVALSGGGATGSSPAEFLFAVAWAEDGDLGGSDFEDWILFFDNPISVNTSNGTFSMPASLTSIIHGTGMIDDVEKELTVTVGDSATGHLYSETDTWDFHLSDTLGTGGLVLHLEGTYTEL